MDSRRLPYSVAAQEAHQTPVLAPALDDPVEVCNQLVGSDDFAASLAHELHELFRRMP